MANIRSFLNWDRDYYEINREERNLAAIFYHLLLINDNLKRFLQTISCSSPIDPDNMGIYFEYSYLRDLWFNIQEGNDIKRELIYKFLNPANLKDLKAMSVLELNQYFGAVPKPSREFIQSPGNWSIEKYAGNITDNQEFLKICKFKWAFNAKPDIVIHLSKNTAICIECKFESGEGTYPTKPSEMREFQNRGIDLVTQTSLQKYIMEDLLGIETKFVFLVKKANSKSLTHDTLLWREAFSNLITDGCPQFIREWIKRI